jgi:hypothetical protein
MRPLALLSLVALIALGATSSATAKRGGVDVDVIASGLDNPRHVAVSPFGSLYVAESGRGGDHATSRSCFESPEGFACTGDTGAVTRVSHRWRGWRQERVVTGLASFAPAGGDTAIGPHGIYAGLGRVLVTNGGPTAPMRGGALVPRDPTLVAEERVSALYGTLLELRWSGRVRELADLWAFENEFNPDEELGNPLVDSNPVDVLPDRRGGHLVVDAGGNTLLRASRRGEISVLSLFPNVEVPSPFGGTVDMNAVPTGVAAGRDGAYYVSQLTGFPFPIGGASIFRVDPRTGERTTYATGFSSVVDLDFGRDGTLYVLEMDSNSLLQEGTEGALYAVPRGGGNPRRIELPAGTLTHPGGVAVGRRGELYVSNRSTEAGDGELLEIELRRRH